MSKEKACEIERGLIESFHTQDKNYGYNILEGGTAPTIPAEIRTKMSEAAKGNKRCLGNICSEETKRKISMAQKGKTLSDEHRKHISEAKKGKSHKPIDAYARKKISDAHVKTPVYCTETNQVYPSIQECARQLGLYATTVCGCCKGRIKSVKGYHFNYYNNENIQMPNDYPEKEYTQACGNGSPLTHSDEGEDIV